MKKKTTFILVSLVVLMLSMPVLFNYVIKAEASVEPKGTPMTLEQMSNQYSYMSYTKCLLSKDEQQTQIQVVPNAGLPDSVSMYEFEMISMVVEKLAGDKDYAAQEALAELIFNRVNSSEFPNTIEEVIYDTNNGIQFSPAYDGTLENGIEVSDSVFEAVNDVITTGTTFVPEMLYYDMDNSLSDTKSLYTVIEGINFYTDLNYSE